MEQKVQKKLIKVLDDPKYESADRYECNEPRVFFTLVKQEELHTPRYVVEAWKECSQDDQGSREYNWVWFLLFQEETLVKVVHAPEMATHCDLNDHDDYIDCG